MISLISFSCFWVKLSSVAGSSRKAPLFAAASSVCRATVVSPLTWKTSVEPSKNIPSKNAGQCGLSKKSPITVESVPYALLKASITCWPVLWSTGSSVIGCFSDLVEGRETETSLSFFSGSGSTVYKPSSSLTSWCLPVSNHWFHSLNKDCINRNKSSDIFRSLPRWQGKITCPFFMDIFFLALSKALR